MSLPVSDNPLVRLALRRPVMMMMILASMLVLGTVALVRIPLELIPSGFSPPFLRVSVSYPDATAKDVEERITRPIEQAVATTPNIAQLSSTSTAGSSSVVMLFDADVDMDTTYRQVRDRVARVRGELPDEVDRVQIRKESADALPVAWYGILWDPQLADPQAVIDRQLVGRLERIDGVALVNTMGPQAPQIQIDVDRGLADAYGIDMVQLVTTLGKSNFTLASGEVDEEDGRYLLRSVAAWGDVADIEELVVGPNGLRLSEIATVTFDRPPATRYDRYKGRPSMVLSVVKESQANTVEICDRIKEAVEEAGRHPDLQGVSVESIFVQGDTIRYSLDQVFESGAQGGLIALFVLVFFLRRLRLTILISLSIPLSLFLSLPFMYFTGQTVNIVSLVGLMICIGLVVDNSVVVAENIGRYRRRGMGPYAAALQGAGEVGLAITLATMTTIIVFLPASLLSNGPTQFFMIRMVTPVCVSLAASLFVAMVLIPLSSATFLQEREPPGPDASTLRRAVERLDRSWKAVLGWAYARTIDPLAAGYERLLRAALRRRIDVVMGSLLALGSMTVPAMNVSCDSGKNFGQRNITVRYSMPSDTTLDEANAFFKEVEGIIEGVRDEYHVEGAAVGFDENKGRVWIFFKPPQEGERPFEEFAKELAEMLPTRPGWRKTSQFGDSDGARDDTFQLAIFGDDHERVQQAREELEQRVLELDGVVGIRKGDEDSRRRQELSLSVERGMAERYGVPASAVANTVAYAIRGTPLPRYHTQEREVEVRVRYREEDRRDVGQLLGYRVPTLDGSTIPIQVLADKELTRGETVLQRTNKRVGAIIRLELDDTDRVASIKELVGFLRNYQLPEGLSFDADVERQTVSDMQRDLGGALLLGSIFIFLLMGFLFESVVLPLSVLPSISLSFVGVWWFLYATGETIDPLAGIGIVLLLGVVVNNAIVLIDFVGQARSSGLSRDDAIIAAGRLRFRPILMTALTTIGGMIPLAFSQHTGEGIPYGPFGKALVGGMTTATILTLVVVPVTYTYLDDLRTHALDWVRRIFAFVTRDRKVE